MATIPEAAVSTSVVSHCERAASGFSVLWLMRPVCRFSRNDASAVRAVSCYRARVAVLLRFAAGFFLVASFFVAAVGDFRCSAAERRVFGCSSCHPSSCFLRFVRKLFSDGLVLDSAFGRQLPSLCAGLPFTGSYPGQHRFSFLAANLHLWIWDWLRRELFRAKRDLFHTHLPFFKKDKTRFYEFARASVRLRVQISSAVSSGRLCLGRFRSWRSSSGRDGGTLPTFSRATAFTRCDLVGARFFGIRRGSGRRRLSFQPPDRFPVR
jgi:hypothetical protein